MTGTAERRRRYRAIDKPLRASTAKMNHAVICERITLNRRYTRCSQYCYHDNNKFTSRKYDLVPAPIYAPECVKVRFSKTVRENLRSLPFEILSQMMIRLQ